MKPNARLYAILARKSPKAVIFRRGPSKQVQLISWDTSNDKLEYGQWFKGRIYERRCDLSLNGELLVYFAASFKKPFYSWTAISQPPYLTALALWPKGDCWGGGGLFDARRQLSLNHREQEMRLADGFDVPLLLKVRPFGTRPGWGEDDPIWSERLARDDWKVTQVPTGSKVDFGAKVLFEYSPPMVFQKHNPKWPKRYVLEMSILGFGERDGAMYITEHSVARENGGAERLGRTDWADWSHSGDLLFAMSGSMYRLRCSDGELDRLEDAVQIADFSDRTFENLAPPRKATRWPSI